MLKETESERVLEYSGLRATYRKFQDNHLLLLERVHEEIEKAKIPYKQMIDELTMQAEDWRSLMHENYEKLVISQHQKT